jgi:hypothetical protein
MTSLVVWVAVDQRGPASVYVATDSRITWQLGNRVPSHRWDAGRKTFAARDAPEVFAYVGDVLIPSLTLPTIAALVDRLPAEPSVDAAQARFRTLCRRAWEDVPKPELREVSLVHAVRSGEGVGAQFAVQILHRAAGGQDWVVDSLDLPSVSSKIEFLGSGRRTLGTSHARWVAPAKLKGDARSSTSRAVFSAFCDALEDGADAGTGGPPQLVGLYRRGAGREFGVTWRAHAYIAGTAVDDLVLPQMEWRNRLFERVDAGGIRLPDAQRHSPRP